MVENDQEKRSLLAELEVQLVRGESALRKGNTAKGFIRMWMARTRFLFNQLLGENHDLAKCLPNPEALIQTPDPARVLDQQLILLRTCLDRLQASTLNTYCGESATRVFIGHGRSALWRELKDFLSDRLGLEWEEFNREVVAGLTTFERIESMLNSAQFAFLVMTAEDQHADSTVHARQNVVHEVGLFQGRLGPRKAIILLEEGCEEFSNVVGLSQIRFPKGSISAVFEDIRRVLEREAII